MDMRVTALALGSAGFFGLALVLTQIGLRHLRPLLGASVSVPTTTLIFIALSPLTIDVANFRSDSALLFALAGLLFPAVVTLLTFEANRRLGPSLTGALGNLTPLFAVLLAFLLLGETPRPGQIAGIAIILAGVLLLLWNPRSAAGPLLGWAIALPLLAALIRGLVQPVVKLGLEGWPNPFAATLIGYIVSASVILTFAVLREGAAALRVPLRGRLIFSLVGLCNGLAMLSMYAALAGGPIALVAPLVACYPLATLVFARLLLGPGGFGRRAAAGVAVVVAGVGVLLHG
jgi:drug/metabolite transporter (DMT)-like permease